MGKLDSKFALITGGNSGIGLATARLFVDEGAQVAITGRNEQTLRSAAGSLGPAAFAIRADITDAAERERIFSQVKQRFGALDILFANAGRSASTPLGGTEVAAFEKQVQLNFISVFFTVQGALPLLRDGAAIVLISHSRSKIGFPGTSAYAGSKAAVRVMAQCLAAGPSAREPFASTSSRARIYAHSALGSHAHTAANRCGKRALAVRRRATGTMGRSRRGRSRRALSGLQRFLLHTGRGNRRRWRHQQPPAGTRAFRG